MAWFAGQLACHSGQNTVKDGQLSGEGGHMAGQHRPTARRISLGYTLRDLRSKAKLSLEEAVEGLSFSDTKLQRVETGLQDLRSAGDLRKLLARYGVTDDEQIGVLVDLQRSASSQEWWLSHTGYMFSGMPRFLGIESAAREVRAYHPMLVFGLLQTKNYAGAHHEASKPVDEFTTEFMEHNVRVRMKRKEAVLREQDPLKIWVILYESALRNVVGGADVMREQYEEIISLAERDNVTVQVLPQEMRGYLAVQDFTILHLGDSMPSAVQVDTAFGALSVSDKPKEVGRFSRRFEAMSRSALPPEDTPKFLHRLSGEIKE